MEYMPFVAREPTLVEKALMIVQYPINLIQHPLEALLSIPALSLFIIPAFSSYSTTFNFLFFYLTWAILIRSNDPLKVELLGTLVVRLMFYVLPSFAFLLFDGATPQLAVNVKEHGELALATGEKQGGPRGRWWKIASISVLNLFSGVALQVLTELVFTRILHIRSALKISSTPPFPWSIAKDLCFGLVLREILTYSMHRYALHSPRSRLRGLHMAWQHSVISPFALVAHYDHPIAYLIHVFLPMYIPAAVLRMHLLTYHMYLVVVSLEEATAYSGYNVLPSAFILGGIARRQERHLMGQGEGNYGCLGLIDFLMGTSLGSDLLDDVVDEAEDTQAGKKAKSGAKPLRRTRHKKVVDPAFDIEDGDEDQDGKEDAEDADGKQDEEDNDTAEVENCNEKRSNSDSSGKSKKLKRSDKGNKSEDEERNGNDSQDGTDKDEGSFKSPKQPKSRDIKRKISKHTKQSARVGKEPTQQTQELGPRHRKPSSKATKADA